MNHQILMNNRTTLKAASFDSANNQYMTDSALLVVNFDRVKANYLIELGYPPDMAKSVDALAKSVNDTLYMIEFKNGDCRKEDADIRLKIKDSLLILCDICRKRLTDSRNDVVFVLVINLSRMKLDYMTLKAIATANMSGRASNFLGLDKIAGVFVKKVLIFDAKIFTVKLLPELINFS